MPELWRIGKSGVYVEMNTDLMFSSEKEDWETPQDFFDNLNSEFRFTLDAAASLTNHKCNKYYSIENNGLEQEWDQSTYCNPPYGRGYSVGFKRLILKVLKVKRLLCFFRQGLIQGGSMNLSSEKLRYAS